MPRRPKFTIAFAPETIEHLGAIEQKHHGLIRKTIEEQLSYAAEEETRNRKPLQQPAPFGAGWELRLGPDNRFRVFYDVNSNLQAVEVVAIGVKDRSRLFFAGKEFKP